MFQYLYISLSLQHTPTERAGECRAEADNRDKIKMLMTTAQPKLIQEPAYRPANTCIVRGLQQCKAFELIRNLTIDQYNGTQNNSPRLTIVGF